MAVEEIRKRDEEISALKDKLAASEATILLLEQKLDALCRRLFGRSSEQIDPAQMELFLSGTAQKEKPAESPGPVPEQESKVIPFPTSRRNSQRGRPRTPDDLPVVETVIIPDQVLKAPEQWREIDREVTKLLDYEPARCLWRHIIRPKYVSRENKTLAPVVAPLRTLQDRSIAGTGLLAHLVVSKYCYHMPLYRIEAMFWTQHRVAIPRQSIERWLDLVAHTLQLIYELLCELVFANGYIQVDETAIKYLKPGHGETKCGYFWVVNAPGVGVAFFWKISRAASCLSEIIPADFIGKLQRDGYLAYGKFVNSLPDGQIIEVGCLAHVRRAFFEAREPGDRIVFWILRQIQLLYSIEEQLRKAEAGPALRQAVRASSSRMVFQRLERGINLLCDKQKYLPRAKMAKALVYARSQWSQIAEYLEDGRIEIDNNLVENAIRPTAVGKKNWLFIGSAEAGQKSAVLYTIVENCRQLEVDPHAYLRWVLEKIPDATNKDIANLTPAAFAKSLAPPHCKAA